MRVSAWVVILTLLMPLDVWSSACRRAWGARKGEPTPCHGVILPIEGAKRCARASIDLRACKDSLAEWKRRAAIPPQQLRRWRHVFRAMTLKRSLKQSTRH